MRTDPEALLLIGPTGAGKTPLGEWLESHGLHGLRCAHFDFGQILRRAVAAGPEESRLSRSDLKFLRQILASSALLEDRNFPIAERLFRAFVDRYGADVEPVIVLNGLPRHSGQAEKMASLVAVRAVVLLRCPPETVSTRIAANTGGDRTNRDDDAAAAISRKLEIFILRTAGLVDYYRNLGATIAEVEVTSQTSTAEMAATVERRLPPRLFGHPTR